MKIEDAKKYLEDMGFKVVDMLYCVAIGDYVSKNPAIGVVVGSEHRCHDDDCRGVHLVGTELAIVRMTDCAFQRYINEELGGTMGNYANYHCKTCDQSNDADINHGFDVLLRIAKLAPIIKVLKESDTYDDLDICIANCSGDFIDFLAEHGNHELEVVGEQGRRETVNH